MKTVPTVRLADAADAAGLPELPEEIQLAMTDIAGVAREGLLAMSVAAGMAVMQAMFEAEIAEACGPKGRHDPSRAAVRHGTGRGSVTLGGRRVAVTRPRARTVDGHEVPLTSYAHFAAEDVLTRVVMERMLAGVATRRHARTAEPVGEQVDRHGRRRRAARRSRAGSCKPDRDRAGRADGPRPGRRGHQGAHARRRAHGRALRGRRVGDHRRRHEEAGRAVGGLHREQDRGRVPCWPTSSPAACATTTGCWSCSTAPRRCPRRCARCSAPRR